MCPHQAAGGLTELINLRSTQGGAQYTAGVHEGSALRISFLGSWAHMSPSNRETCQSLF
jgi:hypothetical protein